MATFPEELWTRGCLEVIKPFIWCLWVVRQTYLINTDKNEIFTIHKRVSRVMECLFQGKRSRRKVFSLTAQLLTKDK